MLWSVEAISIVIKMILFINKERLVARLVNERI